MITSQVKNATTPYQHTQSHLPQDNKGLFGGKLEGDGMSSIRNYPYSTQVFNLSFPAYHQSRDIIFLAKSFPSLERCVYRIAVLGGLSLMKSYENTYPKSQCCAEERRHLKMDLN